MSKKTFRILFINLLLSASASAQIMPQSTATTKPGVRWWWMGSALDKENISWSMEQYAKCGIGAVEITPDIRRAQQ